VTFTSFVFLIKKYSILLFLKCYIDKKLDKKVMKIKNIKVKKKFYKQKIKDKISKVNVMRMNYREFHCYFT